MNRFTLSILACIFGIMGVAKAQTQVVAESKTLQPMDVSVFQNEVKHRENPNKTPRGTKEYVSLLEEDFSLFTAGSEDNPDTVNLVLDVYGGNYNVNPDYTHTPGWTAYFVYQAGGVACVGDGFYGFIDTPEFEMAGSVHISFRARLAAGTQSQTFVGLCVDPYNPQIVDVDAFYMTPEWQTYEFDLENPESSDAFIQINCYNRWFLDDVVITRELDFTPAPLALDATNYTMEGFDANWNAVATAEDYLLTVFKRDFYGPEQVYVEPESFEGINNDGQWIDYNNPNFPEGWVINLQEGNVCHVTNEALTGNVALCMDAVGDTIILPSNGGRFHESNISLKLLEYDSNFDSELEIIAKMDGRWHYTGVFYWASNIFENHGNDWFTDNMLSLWIGDEYDEIGIAYTGEGIVWAIDDWDYTTSQACNIEYVLVDQEIAAPTLTYTVSGLDPAADHYYYLKARNTEFGASVESNYISCFGLCPPIVEEATNFQNGDYTANWQAHPKADAYEIHNYFVTIADADQTNAPIFNEDFVLVHNGLEPQNYMIDDDEFYHRLDQYTIQPDWYGVGIILAEGMLGAANNEYYYGRVYTPQITLDNAESFHVKTTVWGWEGETVSIMATTTGEVHSFDYAETGFQTLEMDFTAGPESGRERLRFEDRYGYPFLIDSFSVTQDLHAGDKTFNILQWVLIEDGTAESYTFENVSGYQWEDFAYDLIAIHNAFGEEYQSVNSDYVEVVVPLNVEENDDACRISVYPNPANDKFVIAGDVEKAEIFDLTGRCIKTVQASALVTSVSTASFADGQYLLKVTGSDGSVTIQQMVINH